jgi:hypothetical protein
MATDFLPGFRRRWQLRSIERCAEFGKGIVAALRETIDPGHRQGGLAVFGAEIGGWLKLVKPEFGSGLNITCVQAIGYRLRRQLKKTKV